MALSALELSDIEEIRQLSYTYYLGLDTGDIDLLVSVFADDAVFDMTGGALGRLEGAAAIREFFLTQQFPNMAQQIHLATNHRVELDGDSATGTVYYLFHGKAKSGATLFAAGYHEDEYVRTAAGWRYALRVAYSLLTPDVQAIGGRSASE